MNHLQICRCLLERYWSLGTCFKKQQEKLLILTVNSLVHANPLLTCLSVASSVVILWNVFISSVIQSTLFLHFLMVNSCSSCFRNTSWVNFYMSKRESNCFTSSARVSPIINSFMMNSHRGHSVCFGSSSSQC